MPHSLRRSRQGLAEKSVVFQHHALQGDQSRIESESLMPRRNQRLRDKFRTTGQRRGEQQRWPARCVAGVRRERKKDMHKP